MIVPRFIGVIAALVAVGVKATDEMDADDANALAYFQLDADLQIHYEERRRLGQGIWDNDALVEKYFGTPNGQLGFDVTANAVIETIDPFGPAANAGFAVGDVIRSFDGIDAENGGIIRFLLQSLEANDTAHVVVQRGEEFLAVDVVAMSTEQLLSMYPDEGEEPMSNDDDRYDRTSTGFLWSLVDSGAIAFYDDVMFVDMNDAWLDYLGTSVGALVAHAAPDHVLRPGDVLVRIGPRVPANADGAAELLSGYAADELTPITVIRKGRELNFELVGPE